MTQIYSNIPRVYVLGYVLYWVYNVHYSKYGDHIQVNPTNQD